MYYAAFIITQPEENHIDEMCHSHFCTQLDMGTSVPALTQHELPLVQVARDKWRSQCPDKHVAASGPTLVHYLWCTKGVKSADTGALVFLIGGPIKNCRWTDKNYRCTDKKYRSTCNFIGPPSILSVHRLFYRCTDNIIGPLINFISPPTISLLL